VSWPATITAENPLEGLDLQGIACIPVPTPFAVGAVNTYLLDGERPVLVDTGPALASALDDLERMLAGNGRAVEDLGLIFVSHQHVDHLGLTGILSRRAGAGVSCLDVAEEVIGRHEERAELDDKYAGNLMRQSGIDDQVVTALRSVAGIVRFFGDSPEITETVADGSEVTLGERTFRVHHHPGHSPSDTLLLDESDGVMIGGDHLLANISSNALISTPLHAEGWDGSRPKPLLDYRRSLLKTRELEISVVLPGHGPVITDHRTLIDERIAAQDKRAAELLELLREKGPQSAHELATELWERVAITQAFLTLSEVLGHLDLLIEEGVVAEDDSGDVVKFEAT
jgi:glyoxylase-like metal-dependent hydrolase (beta-lactamase superfamily II)